MPKIKAVFEGGFWVSLMFGARVGERGWHAGSLTRQPLDSSLHVRLGLHGCSPFFFDLVVSLQSPSAL